MVPCRPSNCTSLVLFILLTSALHAQSTHGSIFGRVSDPTNARIRGAKVSAIATGTNNHYDTSTDGAGEYALTNLPPGAYVLEAEKSGFKKVVRPDVVVHVQDALEINFDLHVGTAS